MDTEYRIGPMKYCYSILAAYYTYIGLRIQHRTYQESNDNWWKRYCGFLVSKFEQNKM